MALGREMNTRLNSSMEYDTLYLQQHADWEQFSIFTIHKKALIRVADVLNRNNVTATQWS